MRRGTRWRSTAAVSLPSASMRPAPRQVCAASARAVSRGSPSCTAASSIASTSRKKYAGPEPDNAVTVSICASSSIQRTMPAAPSRRSASERWSWSTLRLAHRPLAPAPTSAGVLGMQRTMACCPPSRRSIWAMRMPAAMEMTSGFHARNGVASAAQTSCITCGFTASTTQSAPAAASALSVKTRTSNSRANASRVSARGSATRIDAGGTPRARCAPIRLRAMLPPPMKAMVRGSDCSDISATSATNRRPIVAAAAWLACWRGLSAASPGTRDHACCAAALRLSLRCALRSRRRRAHVPNTR